MKLFEPNNPMLNDPEGICPGELLRILTAVTTVLPDVHMVADAGVARLPRDWFARCLMPIVDARRSDPGADAGNGDPKPPIGDPDEDDGPGYDDDDDDEDDEDDEDDDDDDEEEPLRV